MKANKKKIALVVSDLSLNGVFFVKVTLAREFIRLGFEVDIITGYISEDVSDLIPEECGIYELGLLRLNSFAYKLGKYLRANKPVALIASSWPCTAAAILSSRLFHSKAKLLVIEHVDFRTNFYVSGEFSRKDIFLISYFGKYIYNAADVVVGVSTGVVDGLKNYAKIDDSKLKVIYNPLRCFSSITKSQTTQSIKDLIWTQGTTKILSVGRLAYQKAYEELIRAIGLINNRDKLRLIIIGDGSLREVLEKQIENLGLQKNIFLIGSISEPEIFYEDADLFVLSSSSEGFGNVIIEALSYGVPVVSTDCKSGPAEILGNGRWGDLVMVGDTVALAKSIESALSKKHDHEALRNRANDFSPERVARQYLAALRL